MIVIRGVRALPAMGVAWILTVAGCGDPPAPAEEPTPDGEEATPSAEPPPPRWPHPIPPERYLTEEVASPGVVRGTVLAATDGRGVHFAVEDTELCTEERVETFPAGPLAGVVVWLEGIARGAPIEARDIEVQIGGCDLAPRVQLAPVGSTVAFSSTDGAEHSPRLILWDGHRDLGSAVAPADGSPGKRRLRVPGLVQMRCDAHPAARAWIWVQDHPYYALTGAGGTYRIPGIPPGRYVLHAWHEGFDEQTLEVNVPASGALQLDLVLTGA